MRKDESQLDILERALKDHPKWTKKIKEDLSKATGLSEVKVQKWFWDRKNKKVPNQNPETTSQPPRKQKRGRPAQKDSTKAVSTDGIVMEIISSKGRNSSNSTEDTLSFTEKKESQSEMKVESNQVAAKQLCEDVDTEMTSESQQKQLPAEEGQYEDGEETIADILTNNGGEMDDSIQGSSIKDNNKIRDIQEGFSNIGVQTD